MTKPVNDGYITSPYGNRIRNGKTEFHPGLDIGSKEVNATIKAYKAGTIATYGYSSTFGYRAWIKHDDGIYCVYAHMSSLAPHLKVGDRIEEGTNLGIMGNTGLSAGIHLHIELRTTPDISGKSIDPAEIANLYKKEKQNILKDRE
jgi:murein DD-endopeptidase MepM/ murein hydrolase activator NlpD